MGLQLEGPRGYGNAVLVQLLFFLQLLFFQHLKRLGSEMSIKELSPQVQVASKRIELPQARNPWQSTSVSPSHLKLPLHRHPLDETSPLEGSPNWNQKVYSPLRKMTSCQSPNVQIHHLSINPSTSSPSLKCHMFRQNIAERTLNFHLPRSLFNMTTAIELRTWRP